MSAPMRPAPSEYSKALAEWKRRLCDWIGFDQSQVIDIDTTKHPYVGSELVYDGFVDIEVTWSAVEPQTDPRHGHAGPLNGSSDGVTTTFSGSVWLHSEADYATLAEKVGERPEMFNAEQRAALMRAFRQDG